MQDVDFRCLKLKKLHIMLSTLIRYFRMLSRSWWWIICFPLDRVLGPNLPWWRATVDDDQDLSKAAWAYPGCDGCSPRGIDARSVAGLSPVVYTPLNMAISALLISLLSTHWSCFLLLYLPPHRTRYWVTSICWALLLLLPFPRTFLLLTRLRSSRSTSNAVGCSGARRVSVFSLSLPDEALTQIWLFS